VAPCDIDLLPPSEAFETAWICFWSSHCDWQVQIAAEASDAEMSGIVVHEIKELDILVLDDTEPDTMDSGIGPQVECHD
jgi:hypothetical protein